MQAHRGSFLATPTAELSSQEEMLLGDILDWSLDTSCSGYEGDRESEGEKDGESEWGEMAHISTTSYSESSYTKTLRQNQLLLMRESH